MYHGDTNERQRSELHVVRKEGGRENASEPDQHWQPLADPLAAGSLVTAIRILQDIVIIFHYHTG